MVKAVEFKNEQGLMLRGFLHLVEESKEIVVMLHGFTGNKTEHNGHFRNLSRMLEKIGVSSLRMDYDCNGESDGEIKLKVDADLGELGEFLSADDEAVIKLEETEEDGEQGYQITSSIGIDVENAVASNYSFSFGAEVLDGLAIVGSQVYDSKTKVEEWI